MENLLVPDQAITDIPCSKALVLAPHPDDEVFGCGGAIMRHVEQGTPVCVIILTDGAYGVDQAQTAEYTQQRQNESIAAADVLGYGSPIFWHYQDRQISYNEKLVQKVMTAIVEANADLIYAPSVFEIHPDHRALGMIAMEAFRRLNKAAKLALYEVGKPLEPTQLLDISHLMARKMNAMECFVSQNAQQRYDLDIAALNRYRTYTLPAHVTAAEAYILLTANELIQDPLKLYQSEHVRQKSLGLFMDKLDTPLVSVIIRSMDRPTLSNALDSVALQTYTNIEVVVVNAKGTNHCRIGNWCGNFPMRMVTKDKALPRSQAANVGLESANGKFLIFLDDDDWFAAHHINALAAELERSESTMAAYSAVQCINAAGDEIKRFEEDFDPIKLRIDNYIPIHALLFRRSIVDQGAHFDEMLTVCEDWDFWLQILEQGHFRFVSEVGAYYRIEKGSGSGVWENTARTQQMMTIIYRKWMPRWDDEILWKILGYARCTNIINIRDKEIFVLNQVIDTLTHTISEREQLVADMNSQMKNILTSNSWRITKPLRIIGNLIKK